MNGLSQTLSYQINAIQRESLKTVRNHAAGSLDHLGRYFIVIFVIKITIIIVKNEHLDHHQQHAVEVMIAMFCS